MKRLKTFQVISSSKPRKENQHLGIIIGCIKCDTGRIFKIDENLKLLRNRKVAHFGITTVCEQCGHKSGVILCWIDANKKGYSYRSPSASKGDEITVVGDESGLVKLK